MTIKESRAVKSYMNHKNSTIFVSKNCVGFLNQKYPSSNPKVVSRDLCRNLLFERMVDQALEWPSTAAVRD